MRLRFLLLYFLLVRTCLVVVVKTKFFCYSKSVFLTKVFGNLSSKGLLRLFVGFKNHPVFLTHLFIKLGLSLNSRKLTKFLFKSYLTDFIRRFSSRLLKRGSKYSLTVSENFLIFLKYTTQNDPIELLQHLFFSQYQLPFKISFITRSNRRYLFPNPFDSETEMERFFMKKYGLVINKRSELFFLARFFNELIAFMTQGSISLLRDLLNGVVDIGMENRAFIHYRWIVSVKKNH